MYCACWQCSHDRCCLNALHEHLIATLQRTDQATTDPSSNGILITRPFCIYENCVLTNQLVLDVNCGRYHMGAHPRVHAVRIQSKHSAFPTRTPEIFWSKWLTTNEFMEPRHNRLFSVEARFVKRECRVLLGSLDKHILNCDCFFIPKLEWAATCLPFSFWAGPARIEQGLFVQSQIRTQGS